jgi:hypothetical protein
MDVGSGSPCSVEAHRLLPAFLCEADELFYGGDAGAAERLI